MPTYDYTCTACGHAWEALQKISEPPLERCPACEQNTAKRMISGGNFVLKGGGWYADLYSSPRSKSANDSAASSSGSSASSSSSSSGSSSSSSSSSGSSSSGSGSSSSS